MAFFKAVCAKNNQKIELLLQYDSIEEAREYLHKELYSIIELKETSETISDTGVFYFEVLVDWKVKSGQINSDDIFKAYTKLVDSIGYNVISIFDDKNKSEREKTLMTQKVKNSYEIYKKSTFSFLKTKEETVTKTKEETEKKQAEEKLTWKNEEVASFITKEFDYYYKLVDKVIEKIENILNIYNNEIEEEKKVKLIELFNALKKIKNVTNLPKLKQIWEMALIKIWELQQDFIQNNILETKKEILNDTNKLLKWFGSSKQIRLPEDDIKLKINLIITDFYNKFVEYFKQDKKEKIDKNSWKYFNILREQNIYKTKLRDVNKAIFKAIFNKEIRDRLILKKKLIIQNITLLDNRIKNKKISYTKTVKGFNFYKDVIFYILQKIGDIMTYSLLIYSIFFLAINQFIINNIMVIKINYNFILYITLFSILGFLIKITRNIKLLVLNSIIYFILFFYLIINF